MKCNNIMYVKNLGDRFKGKIRKANRADSIFILTSIIFIVFYIYKYLYNPCVIDRASISSFFSLIVQILSSVFAILIAVSLVAIQLTAQNYSSKLIKIYTNSFHFKFFIAMFIIAIILNIYVLFDIEKIDFIWINISVLFSILSIIELVPFIFAINRNLDPKIIIEHLVNDLEHYSISKEYSEFEPYDSIFQPIEDIITRSISNFDYQTAKYGIKLFIKMCKTFKYHSIFFI